MKFTKKALNNLKNMEGYNDRLTKRVINDLLGTGLSTEELKDHINYKCLPEFYLDFQRSLLSSHNI